MKRMERVIAALLLAIAVAGGALIPRLLAGPARPLGIPLGLPPNRIVVQAPVIPKTPPKATRPHRSSTASRAGGSSSAPARPGEAQQPTTSDAAQRTSG